MCVDLCVGVREHDPRQTPRDGVPVGWLCEVGAHAPTAMDPSEF